MSGVRVKICGVNSAEAFDAAADAGADWIGFVFFPRSPRHVTPARAAALSGRRAGGPLRVGLFVEPDDGDVGAALAALRLDVLQLYAPPERVRALRARFGVPVWLAVGVASEPPRALAGADGYVIEARAPSGADRPGGNALTLDWRRFAGWDAPAPWLLAGGLTPDNVGEAVRLSGARAVDVSSGVERAPGEKDAARIRRFVEQARTAAGMAVPGSANAAGASLPVQGWGEGQ